MSGNNNLVTHYTLLVAVKKYMTEQMDLTPYLGKIIKIKIDRPINSKHPEHGFVYGINYGYVPNTKAPDREEIDAYLVGVFRPVKEYKGKCIAIVHRKDDNDDKLVIAPINEHFSEESIKNAVYFQEKFFDSHVIMDKKRS